MLVSLFGQFLSTWYSKNMKLRFIFLLFVLLLPTQIQAATPKVTPKTLEVSGWIPYWRTSSGTADALAHIDAFTEISPFGYTVKNDGTLFDAMKIGSSSITELVTVARSKKVKIIPTVMWSDADKIEAILKDKKARTAHVKAIVAMIKVNGFDGVDIDYEGKHASTRPYFTAFLKELYNTMTSKMTLVCTIEPRTPLTDRFDKIPNDIEFANDLPMLNKYCDRVRIMAYDQLRIDLRLNASSTAPYAPVADVRWVEKVVRLMMKDIDKKKISIGVATYGYENEITQNPSGSYSYKFKWSFNPRYGVDMATSLGVSPTRGESGELTLIYSTTSPSSVTPTSTDPLTVNSSEGVGAVATGTNGLATTTQTLVNPMVKRLLSWSDAGAIKDKVDLAKRLGVRGIAIFKIDGGEDPAMWSILK